MLTLCLPLLRDTKLLSDIPELYKLHRSLSNRSTQADGIFPLNNHCSQADLPMLQYRPLRMRMCSSKSSSKLLQRHS